jgi:hypothetical protein
MDALIHIFGIRHHGPGSARSLTAALNQVKPDCILIEGPPDAAEVLSLAADESMKPPVAILIHAADEPRRAVYYPFAIFSPEWNAIRWAQQNNAAVRFFDLPMAHSMAIDKDAERKFVEELEAAAKAAAGSGESEGLEPPAGPAIPLTTVPPAPVPPPIEAPDVRRDPIGELAKAAGFEDGERWWEHVVEHREEADIFAAIRDAMAMLRETETKPREKDDLREAWMRKTIREAKKDRFKSIAVVCGAWHAPVMDVDAFAKKDDDALLKGLPKLKVSATWVPWTYDHLSFASGYGAGVRSPGWYEHVWRSRGSLIESWMTRVARLLRDKGIDCSSAHIIEGVRLSHTLATLRDRPLPDLSDIQDAVQSVFCFDSDLPLKLIRQELFVGNRLGEIPEQTPMIPLQQDLLRLQKSLRMKPEAMEKSLDLDLRNDIDRGRSSLLHRLILLGVNWGTAQKGKTGKGTFHELWTLRWDPGLVVPLIVAGSLGNTIEQAAAAQLRKVAGETTELRVLVDLLDNALLADLGDAVTMLVRQIEAIAAVAQDVTLLMSTLPGLARVLRYGSVRETDTGMVRDIVDGIVPRVTIGLGGALSSLNDDAARAMVQQIAATHTAIELLENPGHTADWIAAITRVVDQPGVHGLVRGKACRLLLDGGKLTGDDAAKQLGLMLSPGTEAWQAAMWIDGFLAGSGLLLVHDPKLLAVIDQWIAGIGAEQFDELVPILRRTFSVFPKPERRQIGQAVARGGTVKAKTAVTMEDIDEARAMRAIPLLIAILGGNPLLAAARRDEIFHGL